MDKSKGGKKTKSTIATKEEIPIKKTKAKPVEVKPVEVKPVEVKPVEVKPIKVKKTKAKPVDVKPIKVKKTKDKPVEKVKEESKPEDFDTSGDFRLDDDGVELLKQILLNRGTNNNIKVTKDGVTNENVDIGELFNTIFNNKGTTNTFVNEAPKKKKKKKSKSEIQPNTVEENFTINYFSKSKDVKIAGLFNRWEPEPMIKGKDNEWSYTKKFRNGIYKFNFIVDGIWCHDDRYSTDERDEFHFSDDSDNEGDGFVNKCNKVIVNAHMCISCTAKPVIVLHTEEGKLCSNCKEKVYNDDDAEKDSDDECPDCNNYTLTQVKLGKKKVLACSLCDDLT